MSPTVPMDSERKQKLLNRLKRANGQLRAIQGMIERDDGCADVAQQMSAVRSALEKAYFELMTCAIEAKVSHSIDEGANWKDDLNDMSELLVKYA